MPTVSEDAIPGLRGGRLAGIFVPAPPPPGTPRDIVALTSGEAANGDSAPNARTPVKAMGPTNRRLDARGVRREIQRPTSRGSVRLVKEARHSSKQNDRRRLTGAKERRTE